MSVNTLLYSIIWKIT